MPGFRLSGAIRPFRIRAGQNPPVSQSYPTLQAAMTAMFKMSLTVELVPQI